jgi:hypothetical protein
MTANPPKKEGAPPTKTTHAIQVGAMWIHGLVGGAGCVVAVARHHTMKIDVIHTSNNIQHTLRNQQTKIAEEPREDGSFALVGAHPALAESFAELALQQRLVPEFGRYST